MAILGIVPAMEKEPRPKLVLKKAYRPAKATPKKQPPVRERPLTEAGEAFVHQLVWRGLTRDEAAEAAGISVDYARRLLKSPEVMQIHQRELAALRESAKARAFHRLEVLAQQDDNQTAAVAAAKLILAHGEEKSAGLTVNLNVTPGYVIDPTRAFARRPPSIDLPDSDILVIDQEAGSGAVNATVGREAAAPVQGQSFSAKSAPEPSETRGPQYWRGSMKREGGE